MKQDLILNCLFICSLLFCYSQLTKEHEIIDDENFYQIDDYWNQQNYEMKNANY